MGPEYTSEQAKAQEITSKLPLGSLSKGLAVLHDRISSLENRLTAVLGPENDMGGSDPNEKPSGSPLYLELNDYADSLARANRRLDSLVDRIEC